MIRNPRWYVPAIAAACAVAAMAAPASAATAAAASSYRVCTGPNLSRSCESGQLTPGGIRNFSAGVANYAESYEAFGNITLKLFTGPNGTGSGFSLVLDGKAHGLNNTKQWHAAYSVKGY